MFQRRSEGAAQSEPTLRAPWAHSKLTRLTAFSARFGLMVAIPAALVAILVEKLVSMIVPAAGAVMAIEGLQAAWGTISRIIAALSAFMAFLLAIKGGSAGALFAAVLASAAVVVLDFVANWLLKKLASAARKVGAKLKGLAAKFKSKRKAKRDAQAPKKQHHDPHDAHDKTAQKKHDEHDEAHKDNKDEKKEADKQKRLAEAGRAIRPKLAALIAKRPSKLRVRGQLVVWKLRYRLTELRMEDHGNRVDFIAKVNPEEKVGNAEDTPLGEELKKAESPQTGFYYRGDDEGRPGDSVGVPLTDETPLPEHKSSSTTCIRKRRTRRSEPPAAETTTPGRPRRSFRSRRSSAPGPEGQPSSRG
jgi:hypothetical protein